MYEVVHVEQQILAELERRALAKEFMPTEQLRDVLRRAASFLCRAKDDQCGIVHHLVGIPMSIFTKQSVKLGIALWLGVINENPWMEPRILAEVAQTWCVSVHKKAGIFSDRLRYLNLPIATVLLAVLTNDSHIDPFYVKEEFAPSDRDSLLKRQQAAHDLIAPHLRILQFLASHFNATRLSSPHLQRIFHHLVVETLGSLRQCSGHPLAREVHFQVIMLGLNVLRYSTILPTRARWKLKDCILSAALRWFSYQPRFVLSKRLILVTQ